MQVEKEINVVLKSQNHESERELAEIQNVLHLKIVEVEKHAAEREYIMTSLTRLETEKMSSNKKINRELDDLTSAKNAALLRVESSNSQCEIITEKFRTAQLKHWAESKKFKEERSSLLSKFAVKMDVFLRIIINFLFITILYFDSSFM
jgi:predicted transposase YbfD/YdcC